MLISSALRWVRPKIFSTRSCECLDTVNRVSAEVNVAETPGQDSGLQMRGGAGTQTSGSAVESLRQSLVEVVNFQTLRVTAAGCCSETILNAN